MRLREWVPDALNKGHMCVEDPPKPGECAYCYDSATHTCSNSPPLCDVHKSSCCVRTRKRQWFERAGEISNAYLEHARASGLSSLEALWKLSYCRENARTQMAKTRLAVVSQIVIDKIFERDGTDHGI